MFCRFGYKTVMNETQPYKSRTQHKKEAEALQKLGLDLAGLSIEQLRQAQIPEELKTAVIEYKSITSKNAAKRQQQYIGALMRDADPELIHNALATAQHMQIPDSDSDREARKWLDRLITMGPDEVENVLSAYPRLDRQRLRQLVRNALKTKSAGKKSKPLDALQKALKQAIEEDQAE